LTRTERARKAALARHAKAKQTAKPKQDIAKPKQLAIPAKTKQTDTPEDTNPFTRTRKPTTSTPQPTMQTPPRRPTTDDATESAKRAAAARFIDSATK
jgi:hypothetical protein